MQTKKSKQVDPSITDLRTNEKASLNRINDMLFGRRVILNELQRREDYDMYGIYEIRILAQQMFTCHVVTSKTYTLTALIQDNNLVGTLDDEIVHINLDNSEAEDQFIENLCPWFEDNYEKLEEIICNLPDVRRIYKKIIEQVSDVEPRLEHRNKVKSIIDRLGHNSDDLLRDALLDLMDVEPSRECLRAVVEECGLDFDLNDIISTFVDNNDYVDKETIIELFVNLVSDGNNFAVEVPRVIVQCLELNDDGTFNYKP